MRYGKWLVTVSVVALAGAMGTGALADTGLAPQIRSEGGVRVKVVPRDLTPGAGTWEFELTLDTHTVALDQDLARSSLLVDGQGNRYSPTGWEGDPPGGHHRKGVLRFKALAALPSAIELRLEGVGGVQRVFHWQLK